MIRKDNAIIDLKEIEKLSLGGKYLFTISVPQNVGWIDSMELVIDSLGYPFLRTVLSEVIDARDEYITYERNGKENGIFVAINNSDVNRTVYIPKGYRDGKTILTLQKSNKEVLHPRGGIILKK